MRESFEARGLPERSVLYISIQSSASHPMRNAAVSTDPGPDYDLTRLVNLLGSNSRRYFCQRVIDGTVEPLPRDLSSYSGLVIGCSVHSANLEDGPLESWQENVAELIQRAVLDYKLPYLGICGGGQLGLLALGGSVRGNPAGVGLTGDQERSLVIRTTQVKLTDAGMRDPLLEGCAPSFGMSAVHTDYLAEAPEEKGFTALAHSSDIPNQIVAYGDRARLLGVHPEVTQGFMARSAPKLLKNGAFRSIPHDQISQAFSSIRPDEDSNLKIVSNFLLNFCTPRAQEMGAGF